MDPSAHTILRPQIRIHLRFAFCLDENKLKEAEIGPYFENAYLEHIMWRPLPTQINQNVAEKKRFVICYIFVAQEN